MKCRLSALLIAIFMLIFYKLFCNFTFLKRKWSQVKTFWFVFCILVVSMSFCIRLSGFVELGSADCLPHLLCGFCLFSLTCLATSMFQCFTEEMVLSENVLVCISAILASFRTEYSGSFELFRANYFHCEVFVFFELLCSLYRSFNLLFYPGQAIPISRFFRIAGPTPELV